MFDELSLFLLIISFVQLLNNIVFSQNLPYNYKSISYQNVK